MTLTAVVTGAMLSRGLPRSAPRAREAIENIVQVVREGDDAHIRTLLAALSAVTDTAALLYLRERLYAPE